MEKLHVSGIDVFYPHNYTHRNVASCSFLMNNKHFSKYLNTHHCAENHKCIILLITTTCEYAHSM